LGYKHIIEVPVVVGVNTAQILVVAEIPLTPPAFKINEIHKLVEIDECVSVCDKVIINGRLVKNITFKTLGERDSKSHLKRICGDLRHCTVEIPFHLFIDVKGAREGDLCVVEDAIVAGEFDKLIDPICDKTFGKLLEKAVLKIRAKVVRMRNLKVDANDVTPDKLFCPQETDVVEEFGLDIPEEKKHL
jgi:hypothetical protein